MNHALHTTPYGFNMQVLIICTYVRLIQAALFSGPTSIKNGKNVLECRKNAI